MKKLILSLVTTGAILASAHAFAETIIDETFTNPPGATTGRLASPTDLPGTDWTQADNSWGPVGNGGNAYVMNTDSSVEISLGSYASSPVLTVSSYVLNNNLTDGGGSDVYYRGTALGFFTPAYATGGHGVSGFTGLQLNLNGDLSLYIDGNNTGVHSVWDTADAGAYSESDTLSLSYTIDFATGTVSDVNLGGRDYSSAFTGTYAGLLTPGLADYAGAGVSSASGNTTGYMGIEFTVSSPAPEPATDGLFALGGGLLLAGWLRSRRAKA